MSDLHLHQPDFNEFEPVEIIEVCDLARQFCKLLVLRIFTLESHL